MAKLTTAQLFKNIKTLVEQNKQALYAIANTTLTETYFHIGRLIVEHEQQGSNRATYAKETLINLSTKLTDTLGKGFSVDNLENMRKFYIVYKDDYLKYISKNQKSEAVPRKLEIKKSEALPRKLSLSPFKLSWTHYVMLLKIENPIERKFYEIEATSETWSSRELQRQFESALFERLALSKNKTKVKELGKKGQVILKPSDAIKDPYILEFLDLQMRDTYSENDLETALLNKIELFLQELGKGFLFLHRQKRIIVDGDEYRIDLVFYHRILRCFALFDIKIGTLKHQDIGQMQMYVNYYDEEIKAEEESKTIGIILCKDKKESTIKYTLGKTNKQIFASQYKMYFPEKQLLKLLDTKK